jgi:hypothetical protein
MDCPRCAQRNQEEFPSEINIHFTGSNNIGHPGLLVFPKLLVCLDCGFTQFTVEEGELDLLRESIAA